MKISVHHFDGLGCTYDLKSSLLYSVNSTKYPAALTNLVAKTFQVKNYQVVVKILKKVNVEYYIKV